MLLNIHFCIPIWFNYQASSGNFRDGHGKPLKFGGKFWKNKMESTGFEPGTFSILDKHHKQLIYWVQFARFLDHEIIVKITNVIQNKFVAKLMHLWFFEGLTLFSVLGHRAEK